MENWDEFFQEIAKFREGQDLDQLKKTYQEYFEVQNENMTEEITKDTEKEVFN